MARIVYCWEVGEGFGHLLPYKPLFKALRDRGHEVLFLLKDLSNAEKVFFDLPASYTQCPKRSMQVGRLSTPRSYRDVLINQGFLETETLLARVKGWLTLFEMWRPDLIILNHCPTGLLAARLYPARRLYLGSGFFEPPRREPWPQYFAGSMAAPDRQVAEESLALLTAINRILKKLGGEQLSELAGFFGDTEACFTTFKELDHYLHREPVEYLGIMPPVRGGKAVAWPEGSGRKVFAYLKPNGRVEELLHALRELALPILVVGPGLPGPLIQRFASTQIGFSREMLDMAQLGRECDVAITNGNHDTAISLLLAGKPLFSFAIHVENFLLGEAVGRLGAGVTVKAAGSEPIAPALHELMFGEKYFENAAKFAARHRGFNPVDAMARVVERIEGLAMAPGAGTKVNTV